MFDGWLVAGQVAPFYAGRTELGEAVCLLARMRVERQILEAAMDTPSSQIMLRIHRDTSRPPGPLVRRYTPALQR